MKQGRELEEYKEQARLFLETGVDHYLAKMDSNVGMTMLNNMLYFSERPDLECSLEWIRRRQSIPTDTWPD